jgi:hypothetical protein
MPARTTNGNTNVTNERHFAAPLMGEEKFRKRW